MYEYQSAGPLPIVSYSTVTVCGNLRIFCSIQGRKQGLQGNVIAIIHFIPVTVKHISFDFCISVGKLIFEADSVFFPVLT